MLNINIVRLARLTIGVIGSPIQTKYILIMKNIHNQFKIIWNFKDDELRVTYITQWNKLE